MRVNLTELTVLAVWVPPIAFLLGGVLAGLIAERAILVRAERHAARREWAGEELVLSALRGFIKRLHARYREEGVRFRSNPGVWVGAEEEGRFGVRRHTRVP